ncbi:complement factor H-related protein 1-like [Pempheris klunzingeri]|uniref:complement factor H-related protein 1-like n=1 Tax=Pempheris klunzingeri TaxID=3127111 RepID=UPI00397ECEA8
MCMRYLGFVLLVWLPGVLNAPSAARPCGVPSLIEGYFVPEQDPEQESYSHGTVLTYSCNSGRKPAVEGWWATSKCQEGNWSPEPNCIDEDACISPDIPKAKYKKSQNGWYEEGDEIIITCDKGYEPKHQDATTICINGTWSSVPVCEKSAHACGEPPYFPHAVIIHQKYQEVFAAGSVVQYECEDGYTVEGADTKKSIFCVAGNWTEGPTCRSSTTSGSNDRNSRPIFDTVDRCGALPHVPHGVVVQQDRRFLRYQCNDYYTRVGLDTVVCYSDGSWSQLPVCEDAFCVLDPANVPSVVRPSGREYFKEGERKYVHCMWDYFSAGAHCIQGRMYFTRCCHYNDHYRGLCQESAAVE